MTLRIVAGIDFSTAWADVCLLASDGQRLVAHRRFPNSVPGFQAFKQLLLTTLATHSATALDISGEATGTYWLPFFLALAADPQLNAHHLRLFVLNPRWVAWHKRCYPDDNKTDARDAYYIADRLRTRPPDTPWQAHLPVRPLRTYTRYRFHLVQALAREKSFFCAHLFLKASAYRRLMPFSDVFGVTSRAILQQSAPLQVFTDRPTAELATELATISRHHLPDALASAAQLQQVAAESFPLPAALDLPQHRLLSGTLSYIAFLDSQIRQVEDWIAAELDNHPPIRQLMTIPGIGQACAAGIGAEICPVQRFLDGTKFDARRGRQRPRNLRDAEDAVAKIAGLWWPRAESGNFAAADRHLAKSGNAYLRYYLIQAADQLRRHAPEYRRFYGRKYREATKHHHKRALVLTARKSVGLIVGLLHRNEAYRSKGVQPT